MTYINNFYSPTKDNTGRVYLMRYCNNGLAYGVSEPTEGKYFLLSCPILSAEVKEIISEHDTYEDMRNAFFEARI